MNRLAAPLCAFLTLVWASSAFAASPTSDTAATNFSFGSSSYSISVSTAATNRSLWVLIGTEDPTNLRTVSSVTATGFTFTQQKACSVTGTNGTKTDLELWTAPLATQETNLSVAITLSGAADGTIAAAFGVAGLHSISAPFDSNALALVCKTSVAGAPTPPTLTTSQADDLLMAFGFHGGAYANVFSSATWSQIYQAHDNHPSANNTNEGGYSKSVSATQSGVATDITTSEATFPVVEIAAAATADAPSTPTLCTRSLLGVGC